jgi:hypothetical protein
VPKPRSTEPSRRHLRQLRQSAFLLLIVNGDPGNARLRSSGSFGAHFSAAITGTTALTLEEVDKSPQRRADVTVAGKKSEGPANSVYQSCRTG